MNRDKAEVNDWEFGDDSESEELFTKATEHVQSIHGSILPNDLLDLYSLYKQATVGKCNTPKPGIFNMQARAKWQAWNALQDMPENLAKHLYIEKVKNLDSVWHENTLKGVKSVPGFSRWVVHSVEVPPEDQPKAEFEKTVFDFVKDKNIRRIKEVIKNSDFNLLDEHGMGLIHWATDANNLEIVEFFLSLGCPVDFCDAEQQTPLHYASSCGHLECVKLLLRFGADKMRTDAEGHSCLDVADDPKIRSLLEES